MLIDDIIIRTKKGSLKIFATLVLIAIYLCGPFAFAKDRIIIAKSSDALNKEEYNINDNNKESPGDENNTDVGATIKDPSQRDDVKLPDNIELNIKDPTGNIGSFNGIKDNQIGKINVPIPQPSN